MDVVCYYADFGRPYAALLQRMATSAKRVMPGCRTVLLTPTPGCDGSQYFDEQRPTDPVERMGDVALLSKARCRANLRWLLNTDRMTICCDPDIEFISQPHILDHNADIGVLWRAKPDQRVNAALWWTWPHQAAFWTQYGRIVESMPPELHAWWSDQMAFTLLLGSYHEAGDIVQCGDTRMRLMDGDDVALPESRTDRTWAIHYKGQRKGAGWEKFFQTRPEHAAA
jgi:hypothetical protein